MDDPIEKSLILQGLNLALLNRQREPDAPLSDFEFRVFSQFGEDGILQHLIHAAGIVDSEKYFVELGVQDYRESNTRFLLQGLHWRGLIIDGSTEWIESVKQRSLYWRYNLQAVAAWIDRDNINELILSSGLKGDIGLLSIDIDGNDFWVWQSIHCINPIIVACEWNSMFGKEHAVTVPYNPSFNRIKAHYSHQYWGASISALHHLAEKKGYALIGSNQAGNNLFFVRKDRLGLLHAKQPAQAWTDAQWSDTRDSQGNLTFLRGDQRAALIQALPLINVKNDELTCLQELNDRINKEID